MFNTGVFFFFKHKRLKDFVQPEAGTVTHEFFNQMLPLGYSADSFSALCNERPCRTQFAAWKRTR